MNTLDQNRFDKHYQQLLKCLKLEGKADKTIDSYSRAVRRVVEHFDCLPEALTPDDLKDYFSALVGVLGTCRPHVTIIATSPVVTRS